MYILENNEKIRILRTYLEAAKQARAIMSMDEDCSINDENFKKIERDIINDPKVYSLVKNYIERS